MAYQRMLLRTGLVVIATILLSIVVTRVWNGRVQGEKSLLQEESRLIESLDGASLFQSYRASCHGTDRKGSGPAAVILTTKVPDLTRLAEVNGGTLASDRVQKITSGDQPEHPPTALERCRFGDRFSSESPGTRIFTGSASTT